MSYSTRLAYRLANGKVYEHVNRLVTGSDRIVVDLKTGVVIHTFPDGTAGFWGAFHDQTWPDTKPDIKAALGHARFISWRHTHFIPIGYSDIDFLHLEGEVMDRPHSTTYEADCA
jgi:hypothetical protein